MARLIKKNKQEIGLAPDSLYFRGQQKIDNVLLRVIDYDCNNHEERDIETVSDALNYQNKDTVTWFNIDGLHNAAIIEEIASAFNFDNLVLAGVMDTHARPKVQEFSNCIFLSIKMLQYEESTDTINFENLSLILTKNVLLSFQETKGDVFDPVRERIRSQKKRIRNSGPDFLLFSLLDIVVDNYIYIISVFGNKIEDLEEKLLDDPNQSIIMEINSYKHELNFLRKNINPAKEMILSLSKIESELIDDSTYIHYRELLENINHATESTDTYREILSDQLNIYHSTMSTKLNDIMKFLTVFSVIFIPLTFIAGVYGTNFDFVPELHFKYGYFFMWGVLISVAMVMLYFFKKRKWF